MNRFWEHKSLAEFSQEEWESLCDGCGRCCLIQLEDEDSGELHLTGVACRHLALNSCRCTVYADRAQQQPDCVPLTPQNLAGLDWMPESCAYRRVAEQRPLPDWHPLLRGDASAVPRVCRFAISETVIVNTDELELYIISDYES